MYTTKPFHFSSLLPGEYSLLRNLHSPCLGICILLAFRYSAEMSAPQKVLFGLISSWKGGLYHCSAFLAFNLLSDIIYSPSTGEHF